MSFSPVSGSTFALGTTQVTCTSTDTHGNQSRAYFTVHITDLPYVFLAGSGDGASLNAGGIVASSATAGGGIGAAVDASGYV